MKHVPVPPLHRRVENNNQAIDRLRYYDPNFDASIFTSWVKEVYLQLQAAWTKKDWNLVRSLEVLVSIHNTVLNLTNISKPKQLMFWSVFMLKMLESKISLVIQMETILWSLSCHLP